MQNKNTLLIFGGPSTEHEVSIASAFNIYKVLKTITENVDLIYIDKEKKWHRVENISKDMSNLGEKKDVTFDMSNLTINGKRYEKAFGIMHGAYGEDGLLPAILESLSIPYVGSPISSSSLCLDKVLTKKILRDSLLPVGKFLNYKKDEAVKNEEVILDFNYIKKELGFPFFVKPSRQGSSVGIGKVKDEMSFQSSIIEALKYDEEIILEKNINGRELEVSILEERNEDGSKNIFASSVGEVIVDSHMYEFYDYEAKYNDQKDAVKIEIPATLDKEASDRIKDLAKKVFMVLGCKDLARVDFFYTKDGEIFINEINTMPGMTDTSMYPKLMEYDGKNMKEVIKSFLY